MIAFKPHTGAQTEFMSFSGRYALFGGAAGGGKSEVLRFDPFRQVVVETSRLSLPEKHPHWIPKGGSRGRSIFFRRTMPELREVMDRCSRDFELIAPGVVWSAVDKTWTFPCGYKYMFGQMEEDGDWRKYLGFEFTWIGFDELTTFTEVQFDWLDTRLRTTDPVLKDMLSMRAGTNPVGAGVEWVKRRFVDVAPPNTPVTRRVKVKVYNDNGELAGEETVDRQQIFIPAKVTDNKSMDATEYAATLSSHSLTIRRQLLEGNWDHVSGAFLADEWDPSVHICKPFKIPKGWYKFRSGDYGYTKNSSIQWWAVDQDGNLVCYRSLTIKRHTAEMLGYRIREIEMENDEWDVVAGRSKLTGPLDAACWSTELTRGGPTIAETMQIIGVMWFRSTKDRPATANEMRQRLISRSAHPTLKDKAGKPLMCVPGARWFSTCWTAEGKKGRTGPIITLPRLPADENNPDVPDTDADDDDYDSAGYAVMSRPLTPKSEDTPIDEIDELERARERKSQPTRRMGYTAW